MHLVADGPANLHPRLPHSLQQKPNLRMWIWQEFYIFFYFWRFRTTYVVSSRISIFFRDNLVTKGHSRERKHSRVLQ